MHAIRLVGLGLLTSMSLACGGAWDTGDTGSGEQDQGDFVLGWGSSEGYEAYEEWSIDAMTYEEEYLNQLFRLPRDVPITHQTCGYENAYWDGSGIVLCYEMLELIAGLFWNSGWDLTDEDFDLLTYDSWVFILYHELGHALIDVYDLPVPGREEDAVDAFSVVVLVESGVPDTVVSAALFWLLLDDSSGGSLNFADEHSMNMQRFYNLLCWVYGSDPVTYDYLVDSFPELEPRIEGGRCEMEYADQYDAWSELLAPWYQ
mgnify:CR=1 FL=1